MVGCAIRLQKRKPEWLSTLLHSKFFGSCIDHSELRKNEMNVFCIDCNLCFCKHCITSSTHCFHRWLQICKYVYHDVVRVQDIQKHLDCSKIQTYKINGEKAVHLNPRPQLREPKPSSKSKYGASCEACGRHIQDFPNRFCSIACKVSITDMPKDQNHKMISFPIPEFSELSWKENYDPKGYYINEKESSFSLSESSEEIHVWLSSALKPKKQLHKRKGVPRRAPLR